MNYKGNEPLVSVVIPTYSRPLYLERCIESVLNQTYSNIEIIVVDDNDPQTIFRIETEKVMCKYKSYEAIKYLQHDKNKNGAVARNTGWHYAMGKYITFLDDDDVIAEEKIERQVACLESLDASWGMCYTGYRLIKENGANQISSEKRCGNCYIDALMRTMFMGSGSNLFLRKSVVDEVSGYDESFIRNQDIEFMARALEKYKIAYIDEILLTIYQEGVRPKRKFDEMERIAIHYLEKFQDRIDSLNEKEKERVIAVISLERFRGAVGCKEFRKGFLILKKNHVNIVYFLKYIIYLIHRMISHKSYGFSGE